MADLQVLTVLPTALALVAARLSDLPEWSLVIMCSRCRGHPVNLPLAAFALQHGQHTVLRTALKRLQCRECGVPPARVDGIRYLSSLTRSWRIMLLPSL